jgi:telomerase reverse transcriptase
MRDTGSYFSCFLDALNIYNDAQNEEHTFRLLQYIFPRQFKLHNIFTLTVDTKDVNHQSKDYGSREQEFRIWDKKNEGRNSVRLLSNLPKRLKGECVKLIQKLQKRHSRCSYLELLRHYCPGPPPVGGLESRQQAPLVDAATPSQSVSAFCRAVLSKILPNDFFGEGESGEHNRKVLMYNVHLFVSQNRYENMNLHAVYQGIKV